MSEKPTPEQLRAAKEILQSHFQAQEDMLRTERDRHIHELRHRAHPISASGDQAAAHRLFVEAASHYAEDDPSAGAAACWYDLAESFSRLQDERERENLIEAERLLRLTLASLARQRDPLRMARTYDALGRILRKQTYHIDDPGVCDRLEEESIAAHQRAWDIVAGLPVLDKVYGHAYLANLGNALARRDRTEEAIDCYQRAMVNLEYVAQHLPPELLQLTTDRPSLPSLRLHFAQLLSRVSKGDEHVDRILDLATKASAEGDRYIATQAAQVKLYTFIKLRPGTHDRIEVPINEIDSRQLSLEELANYVQMLIEGGRLDMALIHAREGQHRALVNRQEALADHVADENAQRAQQFGLLEAQIRIAESNPIDAFLALENVSALRYYDTVKIWGWSHRDPVARALADRSTALSTIARHLDEISAHLSQAPHDVQVRVLGEFEDELQRARDEVVAPEHDRVAGISLLAHVRRSRVQSSPIAYLREQANGLLTEIRRLESLASAREPEFARDKVHCDTHLGPDELAILLSKRPGSVMLRLHWSRELLAAAVWLKEGELVGNAARILLRGDALAPSMHLARFDDGRPKREYKGPPMAEVLESLDLGQVLPPASQTRSGELILLPSTYASLIPWAAAGPSGATLLDCFESIVWLPNLTPLRMRQVKWRERTGGLIVCPGKAQKNPTVMHATAFARLQPDETQLVDREATLENTRTRAQTADVVSFYAHGSYERPHSGHLRLADGTLEVGTFGRDFVGCERVELWACRSGVNLSTSMLTPFFVDEAFGIDIAFHHAGARSTIGTLWTVVEGVTSRLVQRYRRELAAGHPAPAALARAQRWWRDEVLPSYREQLKSHKPTPGGPNAEQIWAALSPPEAWAGYRFVGVCGRRPEGEVLPETVELTHEERAEFMRLLGSEKVGHNPDDLLRGQLHEYFAQLADAPSPSSEHAIAVARLYADMRQGRRSHHLHRALAWLHEAIAAEPPAEARTRLELETAYLWLELARGELPNERVRFLAHPESGHLLTLERLAVGSEDAEIFRAWLWLLQHPMGKQDTEGAEDDVLGHFRRAWNAARRHPCLSYEGVRARAAAADLLLALARGPLDVIVEIAKEYDDIEVVTPETRRVCMHMQSTIAELLGRHERFDYPEPDFRWLSHRDFPLMLWRAHKAVASDPTPDHQRELRQFDTELISRLEADFWAYPSDPLGFWLSTGVPSQPWYWIVGNYNAARLRVRAEEQAVVHFLATLHMGCDLRLGPLAAVSRMLGMTPPRQRAEARWIWDMGWRRQHLLTLLEECTRVPFAKDPYQHSSTQLLEIDPADQTGLIHWELASCARAWAHAAMASRTAAFDAERHLCRIDLHALETMPEIVEGIKAQFGMNLPERFVDADPALAMLRAQFPMNRLEAAERTLLELPKGIGVLGLASGQAELSLGISWRDDEQLRSRALVVDGLGLQLRACMGELFGFVESDYEAMVGVLPVRAEAWESVRALLDPHLAELLADVPAGIVLSVLAPGFLRPLPIAGLTRGGRPLRDDFVIALLPHLGFGQSSRRPPVTHSKPYTVCVLGEEHEYGETRFGEAAIGTLRACFPIRAAAEPTGPVTESTIREVDVIHRHMAAIDVLRLYGSPNSADLGHETAALGLRGNRKLRAFNISGMHFPKCECVELWGATSITGPNRMIRNYDHDRVPGLAWSFLAAGAAGVVDLAWPVHDLVVALVCERFGCIRHSEPQPGSVALARTTREIDLLLQAWDHEIRDDHSISEALDWLDRSREIYLAQLGCDPRRVVRFANHSNAPSVALGSARTLIECCRRPDQLASFRWWGSAKPGLL